MVSKLLISESISLYAPSLQDQHQQKHDPASHAHLPCQANFPTSYQGIENGFSTGYIF
jgi:hypothetical protein